MFTKSSDDNATPAFVDCMPPGLSQTAIGLKLLPFQREHICRRKGGRFTMILAGCSGTGKSTFLNTLFGESLESKHAATDIKEVRESRYVLCEQGFDLHLTVAEMPEFGVKIDNKYSWLPLVKYIDNRFKSYLLQEEQPVRNHWADNRVHVCVYFLSPTNTQLSPLDIESMKEIAKRVNLIPVVARSDTLNKDELVNFKEIINTTLKAYGIQVCKFLSDNFVLDKIRQYVPFAIIGSNTQFENLEGKLVRARKYHWGMVEVENPEHCDFIHLKQLLISEHMLELITSMEIHYHDFRKKLLRQRLEKSPEYENSSEEAFAANENGLRSYAAYTKVRSFDKHETLGELYDGEAEQLQEESRKRMNDQILTQEARFRDWKVQILNQQKMLNKDLQESFLLIKLLEHDILRLDPSQAGALRSLSVECGLPQEHGLEEELRSEPSNLPPVFAFRI